MKCFSKVIAIAVVLAAIGLSPAAADTLLRDGQKVKITFTKGFKNSFGWIYNAAGNNLGPVTVREHTADKIRWRTRSGGWCELHRGGAAKCFNGSGTWR